MSDKKEKEELTRSLMDAFIQVKRLQRQQKSPIEGLKHSEIMVLFRIQEHGGKKGLAVSEISHLMKVTPPTVTQQIQKLEEKKLVKRETDPYDRRSFRIFLTPKGETVIKEARDTFLARYNGLVETLGEEKGKMLLSLLSESIAYFTHH